MRAPSSDDDLARLLDFSRSVTAEDTNALLGWRGRTLTRAEVARAVDELDDALAELGATGTHVLLYGPLCPAYVVGLLACLRNGAVPVPIDAGMTAEQYAWIERITRPALIVSSDVSAIDLHRGASGPAELVLDSATGRVVLNAAQFNGTRFDGTQFNGTVGGSNPGAFRHTDPDAGYLIPTSGSTGRPKAVVGSRHGLYVFLSWFIEDFGLGPRDVCAAATRVSFDPSLRELLAVLAAGGQLLLPEVDVQLDPAALARHLATDGVTTAFLVPSLARRTARALADQALDLPTLRYGFFAGEPLPGRVVAAWTELAPRAEFVNFYGMTEGTLAQLYRRRVRAEDGAEHGVPVGRPRPGVTVTIDDPDTRGHGEVLVRSGAPALGLLSIDPAAGVSDVEPMADVLRIGDLGFESADGEIVVVGRLGDDMKVSGRRVSYHALVDAAEALPDVAQCVVVDVADGSDRGGPHAFLAVNDLASEDAGRATSLIAQIGDMARGLGLPQPAVHLRADLPLLRSGKVDRVALAAEASRASVAANVADDAASSAGNDVGGADGVIADLLTLLGPAAPAAASASFAEAGLTSLELIDFVLEVNRRHGTSLTVRDCYDLRDLAGVARAVEQAGSKPDPNPRPIVASTPEGTSSTGEYEYPLSTRQLAYMAACMAEGNANWCNLSREVVVPGGVTAAQVEAAVAALIARHDVLRLALSADGTRLTHLPPERLHLPVFVAPGTDSAHSADPAEHRARVEAVRARTVAPLLDPTAPPPLRLAVVPAPHTTSVILVGHHLFLDGLSMDLLADELRAILLGRSLGPEPAQSYRAYCATTHRAPRRDDGGDGGDDGGETSSPAARYWHDLLAGAGQTQLPEAAGDDARAGELLSLPLGLSRARAAHRIAASAGVSAFAVVLAAYHRAVAEVYSLDRFSIVIPVQVREGVRAATAGMFMSQLVVRGGTGAKLLDSAREFARQLDEGSRHSEFEFDERAAALGLAGSDAFPISTVLFNQHPKHRGLRPQALGAWKPRALGRDLRYQLQGELQVSGAEMVLTYYYRRGIASDAAALVGRVHGHLLAALAEAGGVSDDAH